MRYTAPRGTKDIFWPEIKYWQHIEQVASHLFRNYNYLEIRTPVMEQTELFTRGIGQQTDIVSKEMYTFLDKGERSMTLRPEGTASVVRAAIQDNLIKPGGLLKLYYNGPMFRYERPQAGRYRQFHQIGVEAIGSGNPLIDGEVVMLGVTLFQALGIQGLSVRINSVGCPVCRPVIREQLKSFIEMNISNLCTDCQSRYERNPMRILDCKNEKCQKYFAGLPSSTNVLCQECKDHFNFVLEYLQAAKIDFELDPRLVRGLDYYTKTVFEIRSDLLGAQNAVCGGGRYDNLVRELGGKDSPAVGFAFGMERTVQVMVESGIEVGVEDVPDVYMVTLGHNARVKGFIILGYLRERGVRGDMDPDQPSMSAQLKKADKAGARCVVIIGEDEISRGAAVLRNMKTGQQHEVGLSAESIYNDLKSCIE